MFALALSVQQCKKSTVDGVLILARISFSSQKHTHKLNRLISRIIKDKKGDFTRKTSSHTKASVGGIETNVVGCHIFS